MGGDGLVVVCCPGLGRATSEIVFAINWRFIHLNLNKLQHIEYWNQFFYYLHPAIESEFLYILNI